MLSAVPAELLEALKALPADPQRRIKVALAFHGKTQTGLAREAGIDPSTLSGALNGLRPLTDDQAAVIAQLLDVPAAILFEAA